MELLKKPIDEGKDLPTDQEDQTVADPEKEQYAEALQAQGEGMFTFHDDRLTLRALADLHSRGLPHCLLCSHRRSTR